MEKQIERNMQEIFIRGEKILVPASISNHEIVQDVFNSYKEGLKKGHLEVNEAYVKNFESLTKNRKYYVLLEHS